MDKRVKNFLTDLNETKQIWIPFIILFILLAPILVFVQSFSTNYLFAYMALSVLLSLGIIYSVYKVTEISSEARFAQLISLWLVFMIATIIAILVSDLVGSTPYASASTLASTLLLMDFVLSVYLVTFCIVFLFFILMLYLVLSFNFDTFFPFICVILLIGVVLEYDQLAAFGTLNIVLGLSIAFLIVFAIYSGLPEYEKNAMRKIRLTPERAATIYALALMVFFVTHLIMGVGSSGILAIGIRVINIITLVITLFLIMFMCALFWTKDAIAAWFNGPKHK